MKQVIFQIKQVGFSRRHEPVRYRTVKLIHISDTHLGKNDNALRFSRLVDQLVTAPPLPPQECLLIHTGDVIDSASAENRAAGCQQLARLSAAGYRVYLCPGNHDYGNAMAINNQAAHAFLHDYHQWIFHDQPASFPVVHHLDAAHVLILLDSNAAELVWYQRWFAEGHLGSSQLATLNTLLDQPDIRDKRIILCLHHHPFYYGYSVAPDVGDGHLAIHLLAGVTRSFRRLKDAYSLCKIIQDRVQLLLFGHMHYGLDCSSESQKYGIPQAFDGGSSTATDDDCDRLRYRQIDTDTRVVHTSMLRLD